MTIPDDKANSSAAHGASPWIAFRHTTFTVVWIATVVANVGTWMNNAASGWLMIANVRRVLTASWSRVSRSTDNGTTFLRGVQRTRARPRRIRPSDRCRNLHDSDRLEGVLQ